MVPGCTVQDYEVNSRVPIHPWSMYAKDIDVLVTLPATRTRITTIVTPIHHHSSSFLSNWFIPIQKSVPSFQPTTHPVKSFQILLCLTAVVTENDRSYNIYSQDRLIDWLIVVDVICYHHSKSSSVVVAFPAIVISDHYQRRKNEDRFAHWRRMKWYWLSYHHQQYRYHFHE